MRAFLAVPADQAWVESGRRFLARIRETSPDASWTRPESWHLTVRFLGEVPGPSAQTFQDRLAPLANGFAPGELPTAGPVVFPPRGRPRVLAVGFEPGAVGRLLGGVAEAAERAARSIGCTPEDRPFRPHVTFARLRNGWPPSAVEAFCQAARAWPFPAWRVGSLVLYESRLDPAGAVHVPLREWAAAGLAAEARS